MWPWRKAPRDVDFTTGEHETIYDSLGEPSKPYTHEVSAYLADQHRRGLIQAILPSALTGMALGFISSIKPSRIHGRHVGRARIMLIYMAATGMTGVACSGIHQALIIWNNYNDSIVFGIGGLVVSGAMMFVALNAFASPPMLFGLSCILSSTYIGGVKFKEWYQERWLTNFLISQQLQQVPVHKIAPDLQPAYRSFLHWNRPVEERELLQRRYSVLANAEDTSLAISAKTMITSTEFEFWDWINFPDWWPIKTIVNDDEGAAVLDRQVDSHFKKTEDWIRSNPRSFKKYGDAESK